MKTMASDGTIRVGLVGCSWFALRAHVPALLRLEAAGSSGRALCSLVAVCSRTKKSMARAEAKIVAAFPDREVRRHATMDALFADPDVDAVLIVLPIPMMSAAVEGALRAGKHVLSEKPAAPTLDAALHLLTLLHTLGPRAPAWVVLENWALKPSALWLRDRLQEGVIGRVLAAHCEHHHPNVVSAGGGGRGSGVASWRANPAHDGAWLVDMGVHWARLLRMLLGEANAASAVLSSDAPQALPRSACAASPSPPALTSVHGWLTLEHCASAATLCLHSASTKAATSAPGAPPSLRLDGERGSICWWASEGQAQPRATIVQHSNGGRADGITSTHVLEDDWVEGGVEATLEHALIHLRSLNAQHRHAEPPRLNPQRANHLSMLRRCVVSCDEAVRDLALVWALLRSHTTHRTVSPADVLATPFGLTPVPPRELWDASYTRVVIPMHTIHCSTTGEAIAAVELAASQRLAVRPVGCSHSWSGSYAASKATGDSPRDADAAGDESPSCGGVLSLQMLGMGRMLSIDVTCRTVTVEPGMSLRELRRILATHDLTLGSWPMLLDQTIGGATLGAGAHGSSPMDGTLADLVEEVMLVASDGRLLTLNEAGGDYGTNVMSLRAVRISLGLLGIAVSLTLRCEPRYYVRRHVHHMSVSELVDRAEALCATYRHLWVLWTLGEAEVCACALEDLGVAPAPGAERYDGENWYRGAPPFVAPHSTERKAGGDGGGEPEEKAKERWVSLQYAFGRERLGDLVACLSSQRFLSAAGCAGRVVELKFVGGPGCALLGANANGPVVCVNVLWREVLTSGEWDRLGALDLELAAMGGTPHLGKLHALDASRTSKGGEAWCARVEEFAAVMAAADPDGRFGGPACIAGLRR